MTNREDSFRTLFNTINELGSPQINAYSLADKNKPVAFSFHFKDIDYGNPIYLKISEIVEQYKGRVKWIMHARGSHKNYTIEPEVNFKARCRLAEMQLDMSVAEFLGDKYAEEYNKAVEDIDSLCLHISTGLNNTSMLNSN